MHKAGTESTKVNKWSAGCQVFARSYDFECFMALVKKSADIWGEFFTYTLVDEPMM